MSSFGDFNTNLIKDLRQHRGKVTSGPFKDRNVLILSTKGARSGEDRETPLVFSWEEGHRVIVASKGGAPTNPAWYHNLRTHPVVTVEAEGEKFKARARIVGDEDYERLYKQHADLHTGFHEYRQKTTRKIPVIILERIEPERG